MPELVIKTGPVIALTAALGDLSVLDVLYERVVIPQEVFRELEAGGVQSTVVGGRKSEVGGTVRR